jgi:integrase
LYRPASHKTAHHGKTRVVVIGPKAQAVLKEFLPADDAFLFSPAKAMAERSAAKRAARKTRVQPSQRNRYKKNRRRAPGQHYRNTAYAHAVHVACLRAGIPLWAPNQLRHLHGSEVRKQFGLEAAQVALGHAQAHVTQIYAERDLTLAVSVAKAIG